MMPENIVQWLTATSISLSLGTIIYAFLTRTGKEAGEKASRIEAKIEGAIAERDRKIDAVEDRISRVEGELKGVPDRESVHRMQLEMERMRGTIEVLNERLFPLAAISGRLQEFLLEQAKGN